jgi:hypothetical protein
MRLPARYPFRNLLGEAKFSKGKQAKAAIFCGTNLTAIL